MSSTAALIVIFIICLSITNACIFNDAEGTGYQLDLTALAYTSLIKGSTEGNENYTYFYTPCSMLTILLINISIFDWKTQYHRKWRRMYKRIRK